MTRHHASTQLSEWRFTRYDKVIWQGRQSDIERNQLVSRSSCRLWQRSGSHNHSELEVKRKVMKICSLHTWKPLPWKHITPRDVRTCDLCKANWNWNKIHYVVTLGTQDSTKTDAKAKDTSKSQRKTIDRPTFDLPEELLNCRDTHSPSPLPVIRIPAYNDGLSSSQSSASRSSTDSSLVSLSPDCKNMLRGMNVYIFTLPFSLELHAYRLLVNAHIQIERDLHVLTKWKMHYLLQLLRRS